MRTKRILSIALALVMLLGMLPGMSLTAYAEGSTTEITPTNTSGTMTITLTIKAAQTITASDVTATYGDTDKSVSASVTTPATGGGAISYTVKDGSGDYIDVASDGKLTIKKVPPTDGKAYVIVTAAETDDYAETTKEVTITISKAEATVTAKDQSIYVNGTVPDLSAPVQDTHYSVTGLVGTDTLTTAPTLVYQKNGSEVTPDNTTAGMYDIVPSGASAGVNYNISYTNGTLAITAKDTQTITASDIAATYGDTNKSVSATTDGNGEISYAVKAGGEDYIGVDSDGKLTIKKVPADGKAYVTVTASETNTGGTGDKGYAAATKDVTVNISKAAVTITVKDQNIYVGGTVPTLDGADFYTVTGLVGEDTLTTNPTLAYQKNGSAVTPDNTAAGTYDIVASGASAGNNYTIAYANGTLTISDKQTQTITAENVTATYGDTDKKVSATTDGDGAISYAVKDGSEDYIDVDATTGALTIKKVPADGKAYVTVTAAGTAAYEQTTKDVTVTINKANSAVTKAPEAKTLTYNDSAQELVTAGTATDGTMQYAIGKDSTTAPTEGWGTSIPTGTEAGTYYVWYKVVGDANHNDTTPKSVTVTIGNNVYTVETDNQEWTKGSTNGLPITFKGTYADEKTYSKWNEKVVIDGKEAAASSYDAKSGSLVIDLKPAYLETLSTGKHTISVTFSDGSASGTFNIKAKSSSGGGLSKPDKKTDNVVTCQMAGYPANYAWNEAAKACQPGYLDNNGVFHPTSSGKKSAVPNTNDKGLMGSVISLTVSTITAIIAAFLLKKY